MPRTPTKPAADPLADLRGPVDGGPVPAPSAPLPPAPAPADPGTPLTPEDPVADDVEPVLDENAQVLLVVQAWHRDLTAQSFGHSGGTCGCAYLARKAVKALRG